MRPAVTVWRRAHPATARAPTEPVVSVIGTALGRTGTASTDAIAELELRRPEHRSFRTLLLAFLALTTAVYIGRAPAHLIRRRRSRPAATGTRDLPPTTLDDERSILESSGERS